MTDTLAECYLASRRYGPREALKPISFDLFPRTITALVGPNGSGKTTLLKLLAGFLRPSGGAVRVLGYDPFEHRETIMARAAFSFTPPGLYDALTAWEHLRWLPALGRAAAARPGDREILAALDQVGLADRAHDKVAGFSFGMRQRLGLSLALLPTPELLILDEPTEGLDPLAVIELRNLLRRLRDERGIAIMLSSHLLANLETLADRLLILQEGRALFSGEPAKLLQQGARLKLRLEANAAQAAELLADHDLFATVEADDRLTLPEHALTLEQARALFRDNGFRLLEFHRRKPSLEEALIDLLREDRGESP